MDKKQLYIISAYEIAESENYSDKTKVQLINWLNEATESQVKAFLMDGGIVRLNEQEEAAINDRFESFLDEGIFRSLFGMVILTPAGWAIYRGIRSALSEKYRRCGVLGIGKIKKACMLKAKAEDAMKMAALVAGQSKNCAQTKDPAKCLAKANQKVAQLKAKAASFNEKLKNFSAKSPKKALAVQMGAEKAKKAGAKII